MSTLIEYQDAVEARVREILPGGSNGVRTVSTHIGEFGEREVREYAPASPAVILAPMGFTDVVPTGGSVRAVFSYSAYVLAKTMGHGDRGQIVMAIIGALIPALPRERFHACAKAPQGITAGNLYTGPVDDMGIALWAIQWEQVLALGGVDPSTLADFITLHSTYNLDPGADDPDDFSAPQTITLPGPS